MLLPTVNCRKLSPLCLACLGIPLLLIAINGCQRESSKVINSSATNWPSLFSASQATILNGDWKQAEAAWMDLRLKRTSLSDAELKQWLDFQIEILEKTKSNPL